MSALVSVVIPTYKRNDLLEKAINSVLNQTYKDIEIIIVDDNFEGSEYRESNKLFSKKYAENDNVRFVFLEKNLGGAGARNKGIEESKGEYVAFLDDDDVFFPSKVETFINRFKEERSSDELMAYAFTESSNGIIWNKVYTGNAMYDLFITGSIAATSQWVISKKALEKIGGFDITPSKQDTILTYKLLSEGYKIICIPEILTIYNEHDGERISNSGNTLKGEQAFFKKFLSSKDLFNEEQQKAIYFSFYSRLLVYSLKDKKIKESISFTMKMMKIDFKQTISFVLSKIKKR